jgi:hypothetical protein
MGVNHDKESFVLSLSKDGRFFHGKLGHKVKHPLENLDSSARSPFDKLRVSGLCFQGRHVAIF